ncbi:MAG: helix-turn-helix domain-containing protein [Pseudonocardiaceae bacterium]
MAAARFWLRWREETRSWMSAGCPLSSGCMDCPEIRRPLDDGRVVVRGDKPDAAVLAELNLPDHEGAVIVPPSLVLGSVKSPLTSWASLWLSTTPGTCPGWRHCPSTTRPQTPTTSTGICEASLRRLAGFSQAKASRMEAGRFVPSPQDADRYARALGASAVIRSAAPQQPTNYECAATRCDLPTSRCSTRS